MGTMPVKTLKMSDVNVENKWENNIVATKVVGAVYRTENETTWHAINYITNRKGNGSSGVVLEMLKVGGKPCLNSLKSWIFFR